MKPCRVLAAVMAALWICAPAATAQDNPTLGVMKFDVSSGIEEYVADFCTEALTQNLALGGEFRVVGWRQIEQTISAVMQEDPNIPEEHAAIEAIKQLGFDQICRGSIRKLGDTAYIRVWRMDATGAILKAAQATYTREAEIEPAVDKISSIILEQSPSDPSAEIQPVPALDGEGSGETSRKPALTMMRAEGEDRSSYATFMDNRLTSEIVASGEYSVVSWAEVERTIEQIMRSDSSLSAREARSRALSSLGIDRVLVTDVAEIGGAFHLSAQILDRNMNVERIAEEKADNQGAIEGAIKELAIKIVLSPEDYAELQQERKAKAKEAAAKKKEAERKRKEKEKEKEAARQQFTNSIGMEFKLIKPGQFLMGSTEGDPDEEPLRVVSITKEFYMGTTPVTQEQYEKVMRNNPAQLKGPNRPVERVSWHDVQEFCLRLSVMDKAKYRLPTEAEWEYACRAGTHTPYFWGEEFDGDYAWYEGNSRRTSHDVGQKSPNEWGLYDMLGNVWEWCHDRYSENYSGASTRNPTGPSSGRFRVVRGGSWVNGPDILRSANRRASLPTYKHAVIGFRVIAER